MKFHMDKIIRELVEEAWEWGHLGRDREFLDQNRVFAEILSELDSDGFAMRFLDKEGHVRWKATPQLRDHLRDLRLDAEEELDEDV
jgi:hypothetical protein